MYPTVRPGDVLRIRPCRAIEVQVGDMAVIRLSDFLFCHRVIAKGERDERAFVVTRPDRLDFGNDAPTFDEDLIGVVMTITRNGKLVSTTPKTNPGLVRRYYAVRLTLIEVMPRVRTGLENVLALVQNRRLYRFIARRIFAVTHPRLSYWVRLPLNDKLGNVIYRQLQPTEFDLRSVLQERANQRWTLALQVNEAQAPAAWATFGRDGDGVWRAEDLYVRVRYRGLGWDEVLMKQAEKILTD
jgi:hypothetical protein